MIQALYDKCGAAALRDSMLPALQKLEQSVLVQEENVLALTKVITDCEEGLAAGDLDTAGRCIALAAGHRQDCGPAGVSLCKQADNLLSDICGKLLVSLFGGR